jgi:hypothetical protein
MRKRGLVIILASLPAWAIAAYVSIPFSRFVRQNPGFDGEGPLLGGGAIVALLATILGLVFLLIDFVVWLRSHYGRKNPTS